MMTKVLSLLGCSMWRTVHGEPRKLLRHKGRTAARSAVLSRPTLLTGAKNEKATRLAPPYLFAFDSGIRGGVLVLSSQEDAKSREGDEDEDMAA
jgi:hypothetical protein